MSQAERPFRLSSNRHFMERRGPAWNQEGRCCRKKLCLVATDPALLAEVLRRLGERPDCYYVKSTVRPRDEMYLGRCFLLDEREVGTLWAELKNHPRMMCSVQDDEFTRPFRVAT